MNAAIKYIEDNLLEYPDPEEAANLSDRCPMRFKKYGNAFLVNGFHLRIMSMPGLPNWRYIRRVKQIARIIIVRCGYLLFRKNK